MSMYQKITKGLQKGQLILVPTARDFGTSSRCSQLHKHNLAKNRGRR